MWCPMAIARASVAGVLFQSRGRSGRPGGLTRPELSDHRGSCLHEDEAGPGELALREPSESGVCGAVAEVGIGWERLDAEIKPWWTVPENFTFPLEFYIEEGQGKLMFGEWSLPIPHPSPPGTGPPGPPRRPPGLDLAPIIEAHSQTLIRLEMRFTATGLTRVLVMGREMLRFVQKLPLSPPDLAAPPPIALDLLGLFSSRRRGSHRLPSAFSGFALRNVWL
ncbi:PREDICTED: uncharacterized protein LOC103084794 [Lipotes vexillifer]|uniref:Uncharacterized protein LOC103084794 n=1 Tax=Lipotes vexillifer TaxID=118797 RepID=A0A340XEC4_LIPVE|nr:PREDICTED: uncharacterized protein LOC103084794 [Lipotes vexillifer]